MKRLLFLTIALLTLVFIMPKEEINAFEKQSIEIEKADAVNIDGVELQAVWVIHSINAVEVGIMPGYSIKGVYYSEFSRNSNISNNDTYTLNFNDNSIETSRQYGNNFYEPDLEKNYKHISTNLPKQELNIQYSLFYNIYKGVGITTNSIRVLRI